MATSDPYREVAGSILTACYLRTSESVVHTFWKLSGKLEQGEGTSGLVA